MAVGDKGLRAIAARQRSAQFPAEPNPEPTSERPAEGWGVILCIHFPIPHHFRGRTG
tara:strand:+ start:396 stop:566 length:171 start_codon:yes stop_codon:yes gene_type:complete